MLRGRCRTQTYLYDDPDHPDRPSGVVESPAYTDDDRSLLLALQAYEESLCSGCGQPKQQAWHSELDGWYEAVDFVCHGCTALHDGKQQIKHTVRLLDGDLPVLAPVQPGVNTTPPTATDT